MVGPGRVGMKEQVIAGIDWVVDLPDRLDDQLEWLCTAGFRAEAVWTWKDLAVVEADR